jgi:hypothetical protein
MQAAQQAGASGEEPGGYDSRGEDPLYKRKRRLFMGNCNCNCQQKDEKKEALQDDKRVYICPQCNTFKAVPAERPAPECCGKKMQGLE